MAYEMRISDWRSDVCSSDLQLLVGDEFGDNVAEDVGTIIGELVRLAIGEVDQPQIALADKAYITALGRHLGVGCKALAVGELAQRRCGCGGSFRGAGRQRVQIQIPTQPKQQRAAVGGKLVIDNAAQ